MTTNFPSMGEHPLEGNIVNISGRESRNTILAPRHAPSGDGQNAGGTAHRGAISMNGEHNGPRFRPVATLYKQNAAAASDTGRGMRTVPSSLGNRDFWASRQAGRVIS